MDDQEQEAILQKCRDFAWAADELEFKYFNTPYDSQPPRDDWFIPDFEKLIARYCYGSYKRTAYGPASCWMPPRYTPVRTAVETMIETPSKTRVIATFFNEPKVGSVRFILDKRNGELYVMRPIWAFGCKRSSVGLPRILGLNIDCDSLFFGLLQSASSNDDGSIIKAKIISSAVK